MTTVREITAAYESFCPQDLALEGDPVGLQIGSLDAEVSRVLVTLDIREQTVTEAINRGCQLIFAKHPVIFRPLTQLTDANSQEKIVLDLARAGLSVYTSHTNIDIVSNGLNDRFCQLLDIRDVENFNIEALGRIGNLAHPVTLSVLIEKIRQVFKQERLRVVSYDHNLRQPISRVAVCGGSGGKLWSDALKAGADCYITADIYYHTAHDMLSMGLVALDPGHYMEKLFIPLVAEKLRQLVLGLEIIESTAITNPFYDI